jgi:ABC-2 type transport system permease protein
METIIPVRSAVLVSLLRADFMTLWRNRRSVVLTLVVPVIILISWKDLISRMGAPFAISNCITIGLIATGLMGYSNSIARDRDRGIFQRLRVAPLTLTSIMISRLLVQLFMILLVTLIVFIAGYYFDQISMPLSSYLLTFIAALFGGALYLGLGQAIVGFVKNPETVSSTTRLVYFAFIMIGMFGSFGVLGKQIGDLVQWSPYGTVATILSSSLTPSTWGAHSTACLLVTIGYTLVFGGMGIRWFKWK